MRLPFLQRLLDDERQKGLDAGLKLGQRLGQDEGIRIGKERRTIEEHTLADSVVQLDQTREIIPKSQLLTKGQLEDIALIVNGEQYPSLRLYLLRQSNEFRDRAAVHSGIDCELLTKFGHYLKEMVLDLDKMRTVEQAADTSPDPYDG